MCELRVFETQIVRKAAGLALEGCLFECQRGDGDRTEERRAAGEHRSREVAPGGEAGGEGRQLTAEPGAFEGHASAELCPPEGREVCEGGEVERRRVLE